MRSLDEESPRESVAAGIERAMLPNLRTLVTRQLLQTGTSLGRDTATTTEVLGPVILHHLGVDEVGYQIYEVPMLPSLLCSPF